MRSRIIVHAMVGIILNFLASVSMSAEVIPLCLSVHNKASFWILGRIEGDDFLRSDFRLAAGDRGRFCLLDKASATTQLQLIIKNVLGMPIFRCSARIGTTVTIEAIKNYGKTRVYAICKS